MAIPTESDGLLHEIQSKCATLRTAAKVVKGRPQDMHRLLALMVEQAQEILQATLDVRDREAAKP